MIKAVNDIAVLQNIEQKKSEGGIYLTQKQEEGVLLGKVLSIREDAEIKEGMIVGYDPYDVLKYSAKEDVVLVRKNKILFIWEENE